MKFKSSSFGVMIWIEIIKENMRVKQYWKKFNNIRNSNIDKVRVNDVIQ